MGKRVWTTKEILAWTREYFEGKGIADARLSAEWLLANATGLSRIGLYADFERPLSADELDRFRASIVRRAAGEPLQYITNSVSFRYLDLRIEPGVLIPRPETEVLVSEVLRALDEAEGELLVADVCSGSGCIACALASERPRIHVIATDVSDQACALTEWNAAASGVSERVEALCGDLVAPIDDALFGCFDCIVSNPPYVPTALLSEIPAEVSAFEPTIALDGGEDGLDVYRRLLDEGLVFLKQGGVLAVELHEDALEEAVALASASGLVEPRIVLDLAGKPRVLIARKGA